MAAGYPWPQLSIHRGDAPGDPARRVRRARRAATTSTSVTDWSRIDADAEPTAAVLRAAPADVELVVTGDAVIAADGIHSAARAQRYPDEGRPRWNGSLMWRGVAEIDPVLDGRTMVWAGHRDRKFVGYPIADLPDGRQAFNFVAEVRRPTSALGEVEDWNRVGELADFLPDFADWGFGWLDVPAIIRSAPATYLFPMVDRDPVTRWTFGRSTLLGDAAHPMYPIGSNGASQAILDGASSPDPCAPTTTSSPHSSATRPAGRPRPRRSCTRTAGSGRRCRCSSCTSARPTASTTSTR